MDLASLRNKPLADFGERKPHQPGWYKGRFVVANAKEVAGKNGPFVVYSFAYTAEEPAGSQEMKGVNTNRRLYKEVLIFDEDNEADLSEWIAKHNPKLAPSKLVEAGEKSHVDALLETLVNTEVLVRIGEDARWRKERDEYKPVVVDVKVQE